MSRPPAPTAEPEPDPDLAPPRILGRRFTLLRELGRGGMGVVHAAYDRALHREVAVKLVHRNGPDGAEATTRLVREGQALARLDHINVVRLVDAGTIADRAYIAMELAQGDPLSHFVAGARALGDHSGILAAFRQAGEALAAAHDAGIVHRDFKPANVIVRNDGLVQVVDFGLAVAEATGDRPQTGARPPVEPGMSLGGAFALRLTTTGALVGTPAYMAPEQFRCLPVDARTDQFAFCVALFEALYKMRPFGGGSFLELSTRVTSGHRRLPPPGRRPPPGVDAVLRRGLQVDPEHRFPSMHQLLEALRPGGGRNRVERRRWAPVAAVPQPPAHAVSSSTTTMPWARGERLCGAI